MKRAIFNQQFSSFQHVNCKHEISRLEAWTDHILIWYVGVHIEYKKPISHHLRLADIIVNIVVVTSQFVSQ